MTTLALFDLDHTLLHFDSDYEWGQFLVRLGVVNGDVFAQKNEQFYSDYKEGKLDIDAFLSFALKPLAEHSRPQLKAWHEIFMAEVITGKVHSQALDLVKRHLDAGDLCCVVTATNSFVTRPIVESFGITHLVATEPETVGDRPDGNFTGAVKGIPSFRDGKIHRVEAWLHSLDMTLAELPRSYFYSDSMNDLPLLKKVTNPIATNPDMLLRAEAQKRGWPILELFN